MTAPVSLSRLFAPRAIALVGVPGDLSRPGGRPLHFLRRHGYAGRLYLVNPGRREIGGMPVYPSLRTVPEPVDVAWIGVPAAQAAGVVTECGEAGVPFAVVLGAGFGEAGAEGAAEQARLVATSRAAGVRVVGPNTVGFVNAWDRVALTFSTVGEVGVFPEGPIALLSQSGGVGGALLNRMVDRGAGVGLFVSTGNEADLGLADYLDWVIEDGRAHTVACIVEQVREPERVVAAVARALRRDVAVLALKLGATETGARSARSHTGSLVGSRDAWRAWARQSGVVELPDPEALLEATAHLARPPRLAGHRLGMLTSSGGIAVMLADVLEPRGFAFPPLALSTRARVGRLLPPYAALANPVDVTAGLPEETFGETMAAMLEDPGLDAVVVPLTLATADGGRARAEQVAWAARGSAKPVVVYWPGGSLVGKGIDTLEQAQVPVFRALAACAAALGASLEYRRLRDRLPAPSPTVPALDAPPASGPLGWDDTRCLLEKAGLAVAPELVVRSEAEARLAASRAPLPAVVKLLGSLHKTEEAGVRVDLRDPAAVLAALRDLLARGNGCLVQPMVTGVEVLVGAVRDPALGGFVLLAPGGVDAELYGERAMRPAPVSRADADRMVDETPALAARVAGYRGRAGVDREALVDAVVRVGALAAALGPRLAELDLNPLIVGAHGATVVDARIVLEP